MTIATINQNPLLSLVITSYTVERLNDIYELLESVKNQTYNRIEVIFVAERSTELFKKVETFAKEKELQAFISVFNDGSPGQSPARNLGLMYAKGEIIAFVDDDVLLFPDWANKMVKTYEDSSIIGVTGPAYPIWENETLAWLPIELYWLASCTDFTGITKPVAVRTAGGMNMSFRREAFNHCHFSQEYGHVAQEQKKVGPVVDDAEFSINLRLKSKKTILFNPLVRVKHRVYPYRLSHKFIRGQAFWQGYSKALLRKTFRNDPDTRGLLRERNLLHRIIFSLLPRTSLELFACPKLAFKKILLINKVLFYVALGFSAGVCPRVIGFSKKYFK
jgi:glycosyltransferase involved in cell wall biosynthesis